MVQINFALREVNVKIVYYGPGRSGKTTNLEVIHDKAPKGSIGDMMSIATETDRTLFFDFLPLDLGKVAGMNTKFQLYTVPGQVYYKATRKLVLQGADGLVFVADSQREMLEENLQSLQDLQENLAENGIDINTIPLVLQWNKRDLPSVMSVEEMNEKLNQWNAPAVEACAINGDGVFPTLKALAKVVIGKLNKEHGYSGDASSEMPAVKKPAAPAPQAAAQKTAPTEAQKKLAAQELAAELSGAPAPAAPKPAAAPAKTPEPTRQVFNAPPAPPPPPPPPAPTAATPPPPPAPAPAHKPAPKPAAPLPAAPQPSKPTAEEQHDAISREMEKRREEAARRKREQMERIKEGSHKPIKKGGLPVLPLVIGVVILVAIAVIVIVLMNK